MTAVDGEAAIELVTPKGDRPDIAIVDHSLSRGVTGLHALKRLSQLVGHKLLGFILTGDIETETVKETARQSYMHRSKSIPADDLTKLDRNLLDNEA